MFNSDLWKKAQSTFDDQMAKASNGFVGAKKTLLPALAGVALTVSVASALRGAWKSYKQKTAIDGTPELQDRVQKLLDAATSGIHSQKDAGAYSRVYEKLDRYLTQHAPDMRHVVMLHDLERSVDVADSSAHTGSASAWSRVKDNIKTLSKNTEQHFANATFLRAVDMPVSDTLPGVLKNLYALDAALGASGWMLNDADPQKTKEHRRIHDHRNIVLTEKLKLVKNALAAGPSADNLSAEHAAMFQSEIHKIVQRLSEASQEKMPYAQLRDAWNDVFAPFEQPLMPEKVAQAYEHFGNTLVTYTRQHGPDANLLDMADVARSRLGQFLRLSVPNPETAAKMHGLMDTFEGYLSHHSPSLAQKAMAALDDHGHLDTYEQISKHTGRIKTAAMVQAFATQYAPASTNDAVHAQRIEEQFAQVKASMAVGPSDGENAFVFPGHNARESAEICIAQAKFRVVQLQALYNTKPTMTTGVEQSNAMQ